MTAPAAPPPSAAPPRPEAAGSAAPYDPAARAVPPSFDLADLLPPDALTALVEAVDMAEAATRSATVLRFTHPRTGRLYRIVPDDPVEGIDYYPPRKSLKEEVDEAIADADAGRTYTREESRERMMERFPMLRDYWAEMRNEDGEPRSAEGAR